MPLIESAECMLGVVGCQLWIKMDGERYLIAFQRVRHKFAVILFNNKQQTAGNQIELYGSIRVCHQLLMSTSGSEDLDFSLLGSSRSGKYFLSVFSVPRAKPSGAGSKLGWWYLNSP